MCPLDSIATVVNSLQNRVNNITLCITLNAKTGKIVLVILCIQTESQFCNVHVVWNCPTVFIDRWLNSLMFHFMKSCCRLLLLEARFLGWREVRQIPFGSCAPPGPPDPLASKRGPTSKGRRGEWKGMEGSRGEMKVRRKEGEVRG